MRVLKLGSKGVAFMEVRLWNAMKYAADIDMWRNAPLDEVAVEETVKN